MKEYLSGADSEDGVTEEHGDWRLDEDFPIWNYTLSRERRLVSARSPSALRSGRVTSST